MAQKPNLAGPGDLFYLRHFSGLRRPEHDARRVELERLESEIAALDAEAITRANQRRDLLERAKALRDEVWPVLPHHHGRRPPAPDERPLPPLVHRPVPLYGRRLRSVCIALLRRYGELALPELHSQLHLHGYEVAGSNSVKRLADALGYEADRKRVVRTARGRYRPSNSFRPRKGRFGSPQLNPAAAIDPAEVVRRARAVDPMFIESEGHWYPEVPDYRLEERLAPPGRATSP